MASSLQINRVEEIIAIDHLHLFSLISYALILAVYANSTIFHSLVIGSVVSIAFLFINAVFLGRAFMGKERFFFRFMLGTLLLLMLLGFVGWLMLIIYNLDVLRTVLVLFVASTFSSIANSRVKRKNDG